MALFTNKNINKKLIIAFFIFGIFSPLFSQPILIDPSVKYQEVEGWGGSLCWWANIMGGYSDTDVLKICDWITDPNGLNMNIFRFNIGGGDDPAHSHMRGDGGAMPGYKLSVDSPYDWTQDANQRKITQQLIQSRINQTGKNDIILEAFSNSPPYWMTRSGCSAGSEEGNVTNLRSDMFDDFADYLTEVVKYYHDSLGITFKYLEPFNEPFSTWWKAYGGQEGCYFGQADQEKMIRELYKKLEEKDMLDYCSITAMDSNSLDECYNGVTAYKTAGDILSKLSKINAHSYFGSDNSRKSLATFSYNNQMKLWQSESGPLSMQGTSEELILAMATRIVRDMREMQCPAWIDWQLAADNSPQWGLLVGKYSDPVNPVSKGFGYYIRTQFSRFIKPGYSIIDAKDPKALVALSPDEKELIIVISNETANEEVHSFDLAAFKSAGPQAQRFRTRKVNESYTEKVMKSTITIDGNIFDYTAPALSVTTFVIPVGISPSQLTEGTYYIRNKACNLYVGINNASQNAGAQLVVTGETPAANSSFEVRLDPLNGGYTMKPGHLSSTSNYVLDVQGTNNLDRTNIIQYAYWGGENQRFHFVPLADKYYKIVIRRSQKCWSLPDDVFDAGTPVLQMTWDDADHSIWEISSNPVSLKETYINNRLLVNYYSGMINVRSSDNRLLNELYVLNMLGKVMKQERNIKASEYSFPLDVDPGLYLVRATLSDGLMENNLFWSF